MVWQGVDTDVKHLDMAGAYHKFALTWKPCADGEMTAGYSGRCITCPAGTSLSYTSSERSSLASNEAPDSQACSICANTTYSTSGSSTCSSCTGSTRANSRRGKVCCSAGQYAAYGSSSCTDCPTGYSSNAGDSHCSLCDTSAGYFQIATYPDSCPSGYDYYPSVSKCYKRYSDQKKWLDAYETCMNDNGGWLATVRSADERDIVDDYNKHMWLGLHCLGCSNSDVDDGSKWKWLDTGIAIGTGYDVWNDGHPSNELNPGKR